MIAVEPRRAEALKIGYEATDWLKVPGFEEYTEFMDEWTVELLVRNGEPIGAIYTRGPEFHISILPEWRGRWATRSILKRIIPRPLAILSRRALSMSATISSGSASSATESTM